MAGRRTSPRRGSRSKQHLAVADDFAGTCMNLALLRVDAGDANAQAQIDVLRSIEVHRVDKHLVDAGSANEVALRKARSVIGCHVLGRQYDD